MLLHLRFFLFLFCFPVPEYYFCFLTFRIAAVPFFTVPVLYPQPEPSMPPALLYSAVVCWT